MVREFKVLNVKCAGCAGTVKKALKEEFGKVDVNLEVEPRIITLVTDKNFNEENLRKKMKKLGYPFEDEELGTFEEIGTKAKSFVSCAIGKMDSES